jgi:hypothetical protein
LVLKKHPDKETNSALRRLILMMMMMMMMMMIIIIIIIIIITQGCTVIQEIQKHWGEKLGELEIHSSGSYQWGGYGTSCFDCTNVML